MGMMQRPKWFGPEFAPVPGLLPQVIKLPIIVNPGLEKSTTVKLTGDRLDSIKLCSFVDGRSTNVDLKGEINGVWMGYVVSGCTVLEKIGGVDLNIEDALKLTCRNYDTNQQHTCNVKVIAYTRDYDDK